MGGLLCGRVIGVTARQGIDWGFDGFQLMTTAGWFNDRWAGFVNGDWQEQARSPGRRHLWMRDSPPPRSRRTASLASTYAAASFTTGKSISVPAMWLV